MLVLAGMSSVVAVIINRWGPRFGDNAVTVATLAQMVLMVPLVIVVNNWLYDDLRQSVWLRHGVCPDCAYNLTGNTSGTCPECGTPIPPKQKAAA